MKWLIALCLLIAALFLAIRSMQDAALNHLLYKRQHELGYSSEKRPFWISKRILSVLCAAAAIVILPLTLPNTDEKSDPKPIAVLKEELSQEKTRALMTEDLASLPSITLNFKIHLIPEPFDVTDYQLIGFYEADKAYNVYLINNELVFEDLDGNTYKNKNE